MRESRGVGEMRRRWWIGVTLRVALGALLLAVVVRVGQGLVHAPVIDDAYIYLSAARTLRDTGRLAASPFHELLVGITCPLYPTLLAGLGFVADLPAASVAIGLCAAILGTWFAYSTALEAQRPRRSGVLAAVASVPIAMSSIVAANSISGMESILSFLGIAVLASVHVHRGVGWRSGLAASPLTALRPDGILVPIAVVAEALIAAIPAGRAERRRKLRGALEFLVPVTIAASCLAGTFLLSTGRTFPNTVAARIALYGWGERGALEKIVSTASELYALLRLNPWWSVLGFLGAAASWGDWKAHPDVASTGRWLSLLPIGYLAVLGFEGVPSNYQFHRYILPGITAGLMLCVIGFAQGWPEGSRSVRIAVVGAMALGVVQEIRNIEQARDAVGPLQSVNLLYDNVLKETGGLAAPCDRVAVVDTGRPLWILRQRVFDVGGLVDRSATASFLDPSSGSSIPFDRRDVAAVLDREEVDWFIVLDLFWGDMLPFRRSTGLQRLPFGAPWSVYGKPGADRHRSAPPCEDPVPGQPAQGGLRTAPQANPP